MTDPVPALLLTNLLTYAAAARWYAWPGLKQLPVKEALTILLLPHTMRFIGLFFLAPGVVQSPLPEAFAIPAAYGDAAAAIIAWIAIAALRTDAPGKVPLVAAAHLFGLVDLGYAVTMGVTQNAGASMGAAAWIPAALVPMLLVTHGLSLGLLWGVRCAHKKELGDTRETLATS